MKRVLLAYLLIGFAALGLNAQQLPHMSFHMFNQQMFNPAYVGSNGSVGFQLAGRQQWTGYDGAPNTYVIGVDAPLGRRSSKPKLALGLMAYQDQIGITTKNHIQAQLAYRIFFDNSALSFGVQVGVDRFEDRYSDLAVTDPNDPLVAQGNVTSDFHPNTGFGIYYYSKTFYLGASATQIIENSIEELASYDVTRHAHVQGGLLLDIASKVKLRPSFMVRLNASDENTNNSPFNAELNLSAIYDDRVMLGFGHRINEAVIGMIKYQFDNGLYLGYAYDFITNAVGRNANASHEVLLGYRYDLGGKAIKSPRFITYF